MNIAITTPKTNETETTVKPKEQTVTDTSDLTNVTPPDLNGGEDTFTISLASKHSNLFSDSKDPWTEGVGNDAGDMKLPKASIPDDLLYRINIQLDTLAGESNNPNANNSTSAIVPANSSVGAQEIANALNKLPENDEESKQMKAKAIKTYNNLTSIKAPDGTNMLEVLIQTYEEHGIHPLIGFASVVKESGGVQSAQSGVGAGGANQIMPATKKGIDKMYESNPELMAIKKKWEEKGANFDEALQNTTAGMMANLVMSATYIKADISKHMGLSNNALAGKNEDGSIMNSEQLGTLTGAILGRYNSGPAAKGNAFTIDGEQVMAYGGIASYKETQNHAKFTGTLAKRITEAIYS